LIKNPKTKDKLLKELADLKLEYKSLKTQYEKDITERKQAEENLRESKLQLSSIYDTVGDVIYYLEVEGDEQYRFVSVNSSFCRVTGIPKKAIIGKRVNEIIPEPSLGIVLGKYRQAIEEKTIVRWEEISDYPTGRLTGEVNIAPVFDVTGHCTHLVGSVHDITESKKAEEELYNSKLKIEESEIKFKSITNQSIEGISVTDMNGNYKFVNPAFCLMTGYSEEELLKMTAFDLKAKTQIDSTFFENKTENAGLAKQVNLLRKDQSEFMTETIGKIIISGDQEFVLGTHRDITERKRSEEVYKTILRTTMEGYCLVDMQGRIIDTNEAYCRMIGYSREELLTLGVKDIEAADTEEVIKKRIQIILKTGSDFFETRHRHKDGREIFVEASVNLLTTDQPKVCCFMRDMTERKRLEETLNESEERFHSLYDNSILGLYRTKPDGQILLANPALIKMLGYSTFEELADRNLEKEGFEPDYPRNLFIEQIELAAEVRGLESEWFCKDGKVVYVRENAKAVRDADGKTLYYDGTVEDITELKNAEAKLKIINAELNKNIVEKDKLFSIIAHDLRSPFLAFLNLTQMLAEDSKSFSAEELSEIGINMNQSANNLFSLLQNLFEWANMQQDSTKFQPVELSLSELISTNVELVNQRSIQKGIQIINIATTPVYVYADKNMINSVLSNLLWNAVKFTNKNGAVIINEKKNGNQMIEISVKDTGVGINKKEMANLFKIGEKTGSKGTDGELSTGLGLLLCKEFVEKNGGKIWVESKEGVGSTFYFTIRAHE
jgi:hypothetical protein